MGGVPNNRTAVAWFEITVYDGAVGAAEIDAAPGPNDVIIAKKERADPNGFENYNFNWEPFKGTFTAKSDKVTLAFKTGKVNYDPDGPGAEWGP